MTNRELCKRFVAGAEEGKGSNMIIRDNRLYSYYTCICERVKDESGKVSFIYNATKYSSTTSKQQSYLRYELMGRKVTEVKNVQLGARHL